MRLRRILLGLCVVIVVGSALLVRWAIHATLAVRDTVVDALNARFDSKVDLQALQVEIYPTPRVSGNGLVLRHNGRTDVPPLITLDSFDANASVKGLIRKPLHLKDVKIEGLNVHVPPGGLSPQDKERDDEPQRPKDLPPPAVAAVPLPPATVLIDSIHSKRARLEIESRRANRLPRGPRTPASSAAAP